AVPTGLREAEPLNTTSAIEPPRRCLAEISPMTQRTASMMLDLPQPLGQTTPIRLLGKVTAVGSTKDLNPASSILLSRIAPRQWVENARASVCQRYRRVLPQWRWPRRRWRTLPTHVVKAARWRELGRQAAVLCVHAWVATGTGISMCECSG